MQNRMRHHSSGGTVYLLLWIVMVISFSCGCGRSAELAANSDGSSETAEQGGFLDNAAEMFENTALFEKVTDLFVDQEKARAEKKEQLEQINGSSSFFSGYSYADFSQVDTDLTFAAASENSILGQPGYCYSVLNESEKETYEEIYLAILTFQEEYRMETKDVDQVKKVYYYVTADHPELFWSDGFTVTTRTKGEKVLSQSFTMKKTMELEEVRGWQQKIRQYLSDFTAAQQDDGLDAAAEDYDKLRFTFDYIVHHTAYVSESLLNQNICSVFGYGESVCQGYSVAMQYLLQYQGIRSVTVSGTTDNNQNHHAWNLVQGGGDWYWLDVTWGDPGFRKKAEETLDIVNYVYFCVTDEELRQTHVPDDRLQLPVCTAQTYNYYIHEGQYFTSWDPSVLEEKLVSRMQQRRHDISLRFAEQDIYKEAMEALIEENGIFECLEAADKDLQEFDSSVISYFENKEKCIVTFMWE